MPNADVVLDVQKIETAPDGYSPTNIAGFFYRFTGGSDSNGTVSYRVDRSSGKKKFKIKFGNSTTKFKMESFAFYDDSGSGTGPGGCAAVPSTTPESTFFSRDGAPDVNKKMIKLQDDVTKAGKGFYRITVSYKNGRDTQAGIVCDPRWDNTAGVNL